MKQSRGDRSQKDREEKYLGHKKHKQGRPGQQEEEEGTVEPARVALKLGGFI
jgi:hypothetical protein